MNQLLFLVFCHHYDSINISCKNRMEEVLFNGTVGRIQGRIHTQQAENSPVVLILPPHPQHGGTMDSKVIFTLFRSFVDKGFTTLCINYRGVGKSTGTWVNTDGELNDAATAIDWLQNQYPTAESFWVAGYSFGSWIGMQLLMRRPEIEGFVIIAPPIQMYDFTFLSPCPVSGLIVHGSEDPIIHVSVVSNFVSKMRIQKGSTVDYQPIEGANHLFENHLNELKQRTEDYIDFRLKK